MENAQEQVNTNPDINQSSPSVNPILNQRGNFLLIIGIIVLLLVIGTGGYFLYQKQVNKPVTIPQTSQLTPSSTPSETANWKTYTNTTWNYQFQYPSTWIVDELDMEHVVVTTPDIEKSADGRITKFPANYIRVNLIKRENVTNSFEEEVKSVYTESPQCSVGSECPSSPPLITKKTNANSLEYYSLTTGVYNNEIAIVPLLKDKNMYVLFDPRLALASNIKLPDKMLSTFKFTDQNSLNLSKTSPDASYTVSETMLGDYNTIVVKDSSGKVITNDFIKKNEKAIGYGTKFGCQCGTSFAGWIDGSHFILKIVNGNGEEYQYTVDASTGIVNEASFKKVK